MTFQKTNKTKPQQNKNKHIKQTQEQFDTPTKIIQNYKTTTINNLKQTLNKPLQQHKKNQRKPVKQTIKTIIKPIQILRNTYKTF